MVDVALILGVGFQKIIFLMIKIPIKGGGGVICALQNKENGMIIYREGHKLIIQGFAKCLGPRGLTAFRRINMWREKTMAINLNYYL